MEKASSVKGLYALGGSGGQLISFWQVDDKVMRDILGPIERLLAEAGHSEALRQVQLNMLKDPELRHPYSSPGSSGPA